jgi:hypothetical protein
MAVNVTVKKKIWWPVKGPQVAVVFARSGSEGLMLSVGPPKSASVA